MSLVILHSKNYIKVSENAGFNYMKTLYMTCAFCYKMINYNNVYIVDEFYFCCDKCVLKFDEVPDKDWNKYGF